MKSIRDHQESTVIEELVEEFLERDDVKRYVSDTLYTYDLDFDHSGALTGDQMELVSQYQNLIHVQLVAGMLRRLTGRN